MKKVLITGSSRWIWKAIAQQAYKEWYHVIVHGRSDSQKLNEIHASLPWSDKLVFDVSNQEAVNQNISTYIEEFGPIYGLVNNAWVRANPMKKIEDLDQKKAAIERETNVMGALYCMQAIIPKMQKSWWWSIVNIASIKWLYPLSTMSSLTFSATKSWLLSVTRSIAKAYATDNIRCNAICPWYVRTDQVNDRAPSTIERIKTWTLLWRMGEVDEISPLVTFLLWDQSSYLTWEDICIDGGYMIQWK